MYAHAPLGKSLLRSLLRLAAPARVLGLQASGDRLLIRAMASTGAQTYAMTGVASPEDRHGWPACCCHSPRQASPPGVADGVASLFLAAARRPFVSNHAATLAPRPTSLATGAGTAFSACKRRCRRPLPCLPLPSIAPMACLPGRVCREVIQIIPLFRLRRVLLKDRCCFLFPTTAAPTNGAAC